MCAAIYRQQLQQAREAAASSGRTGRANPNCQAAAASSSSSSSSSSASRARETDPTILATSSRADQEDQHFQQQANSIHEERQEWEQGLQRQRSIHHFGLTLIAEQQRREVTGEREDSSERRLVRAISEPRSATPATQRREEEKKANGLKEKVKRGLKLFEPKRAEGKKAKKEIPSEPGPEQGILCEDCRRALCDPRWLTISNPLARGNRPIEAQHPPSYRTEPSRSRSRGDSSKLGDKVQEWRSARLRGPLGSQSQTDHTGEEDPFDEAYDPISDSALEKEDVRTLGNGESRSSSKEGST